MLEKKIWVLWPQRIVIEVWIQDICIWFNLLDFSLIRITKHGQGCQIPAVMYKNRRKSLLMSCLHYENTHPCKLYIKYFILECFSVKQLLVSSFVVTEGRWSKHMLSKNKGYNISEDFQSYWSEENSSLPLRKTCSVARSFLLIIYWINCTCKGLEKCL